MLPHLQRLQPESLHLLPIAARLQSQLQCVAVAVEGHMPHGLQGLRERNWTSQYFRKDSEPWKIEIYEDSGRLLAPSWSGFRATVTRADGSTHWVDMPTAGAESYTEVSSSQPDK